MRATEGRLMILANTLLFVGAAMAVGSAAVWVIGQSSRRLRAEAVVEEYRAKLAAAAGPRERFAVGRRGIRFKGRNSQEKDRRRGPS